MPFTRRKYLKLQSLFLAQFGFFGVARQALGSIPLPFGFQTKHVFTGNFLWTWGRNDAGQLGLGDTVDRSSPVLVGGFKDWASIAVGTSFMMAIKTNGTLWAWGDNSSGQLGLGDTVDRSSPTQVGTLTTWQTVNCGSASVAALQTNGTLWTWGNGGSGRLGLGDTTNRSSPTQVGSATNWIFAAAAAQNLYAIRGAGSLYTSGRNNVGQLGLGNTTDYSSPMLVGSATNWTFADGTAIASGGLRSNGTLWSWGSSFAGIQGHGDSTVHRSTPTQVGAATNWTGLYTSNANMGGVRSLASNNGFVWGKNTSGLLGQGDTDDVSSPTLIGSGKTWLSIAIGASNDVYGVNLMIRDNNTLWVCGGNAYGQLGLGDTTSRSSPVQVGSATNWQSVAAGFAGMTSAGLTT